MYEETVRKIVFDCLEENNEVFENKIQIVDGLNTHLYDKEGYLDSLELVSLLVCMEQAVENEFSIKVDLMQLDSLSVDYNPYETVESLVKHILMLIQKEKNNLTG